MLAQVGTLRADWIGDRFENEPAFALPVRPMLNASVLTVPFDGGLLFEGTQETQVLRGSMTRRVAAELLPLLDGTLTLENLAAALPQWPRKAMMNALYMLYSRGLLEEGRTREPVDQDIDHFVGRFLDVTRANSSRETAIDRLKAASISLFGDEPVLDRIERLLRLSGFVHVLRGERVGANSDEKPDLAIVLAGDTASAERFAALAERKVTVLRVMLGANELHIGPLLMPEISVCAACAELQVPAPEGVPDGTMAEFAAGFITLAAFHTISRIANFAVPHAMQRIVRDEHGVRSESAIIVRMPGCRACGTAGRLDREGEAFDAWRLHTATAMLPASFETPKSYQEHYRHKNVALSTAAHDPELGNVFVDLPDTLGGAERETGGPLDVLGLAALLQTAAGYYASDDGRLRRLSPTGGNLCSTHLRVIVLDVDGLERDVYAYNGEKHRLRRVAPVPPNGVLEAIAGRSALDAACIIVGSGRLQHVMVKYNDFGYRVVNLDAGVALTQLTLEADFAGLPIRELPDMADAALLEAIRLPRRLDQYVACFAVSVGSSGSLSGTDRTFARALPNVVASAAIPRGVDVHDSITSAARCFELIGCDDRAAFIDLAQRRQSARSFAPDALHPQELRDVLRAARAFRDRRMVSASPHRVDAIVVNGRDAPGLLIGAYRLDPLGEHLIPAGAMTRTQFEACISQLNLRASAAMAFVVGDLDEALDTRGARGYRELLSLAGSMAAGITLAAEHMNFASCYSGGFHPEGLRLVDGIDGFRQCPLFSVALGRRGEHVLQR